MAASVLLSAASASLRIASLNLCTDEYLLLLGAPSQIASVSFLSHDPLDSPLWRFARRFPANDGGLLSAVRMKPDVVLAMGGGVRDRAALARRLGVRLVPLAIPGSFAQLEGNIRTVAVAAGRPAAGQHLIGRIRALRRSAARPVIDSIWLGGGGRTVAANSLDAQWMALAGLRQRPVKGDRVPLETLLLRPPQLLVRSDYRAGQYSGAQRWLAHPLARGLGRVRTLATDGRAWTCSGPLLLDEIARLRRQVRR